LSLICQYCPLEYKLIVKTNNVVDF
jgi:hypothetical protein